MWIHWESPVTCGYTGNPLSPGNISCRSLSLSKNRAGNQLGFYSSSGFLLGLEPSTQGQVRKLESMSSVTQSPLCPRWMAIPRALTPASLR